MDNNELENLDEMRKEKARYECNLNAFERARWCELMVQKDGDASVKYSLNVNELYLPKGAFEFYRLGVIKWLEKKIAEIDRDIKFEVYRNDKMSEEV